MFQESFLSETTLSDASSAPFAGKIPPSFRTGENGRTQVWLLGQRARLRGESWMPNFFEWPNDAEGCSLSQVLETNVPKKYYLSAKACAGILRRAANRHKKLPPLLQMALVRIVENSRHSEQQAQIAGVEAKHLSLKTESIDVRNLRTQEEISGTLQAKKTGGYSLNYTNPVAVYGSIGVDGQINAGIEIMEPLRSYQSGGVDGQFVYDGRGNGDGETVNTLAGDHSNRVGDYSAIVLESAISFQPRFFTRDNKTGNLDSVSDVSAPLRASSGGGDSEPLVMVQLSAFGDPDLAQAVETKVRHDYASGVGTAILSFMGGQGAKAGSLGEAEEESPTLKAAANGSNQVPSILQNAIIRRLTPRECERLQAFPDDWTLVAAKKAIYSVPETLGDEAEIIGWEEAEQSDTTRYAQMGNAVCVNVISWIINRIPKE